MSERRDYYDVLGVPRHAETAELKRAYRKLAMELHPDRNPGNKEAENRFKEASEAYQVLSDPERRALYDRYGHAGAAAGPSSGFSDVGDIFSAFSDIFGDIFGRGPGGPRAPGRGADIETRLDITLADAATGVTREVKVLRRALCGTCRGSGAQPGSEPEVCQRCGGRGQVMHSQGFLMISTTCPNCRGEGKVVRRPCPVCNGTGIDHQEDTLQIAIPAGVEDGSTLRLLGRGEAASRGGRPGNLYVILRVHPDERFERDGADLHTEVAVSFPQLTLGDRVNVPTLDGEGEIEIPPGTQPNETIPLPGRGMPRLEGKGRGAVIAHLKLVVPTSLSPEEEQALRAYAAAGGQRVNPERGGFFKRKKKK
jgi:molecular chaperone DnaJ